MFVDGELDMKDLKELDKIFNPIIHMGFKVEEYVACGLYARHVTHSLGVKYVSEESKVTCSTCFRNIVDYKKSFFTSPMKYGKDGEM